ncbi:hypothetical protein [Luteibacter sp. 22Crub2.1]|uniref:hypothetical protein n=1 Tax=Luteibacter sp. 22Crub2.1 TaxID=1283288 RepID=UPI0009D38334|nr:hypothetical protein [Luteibacter sp. 22Crub2.1]SKB54870.1 hypothetical protein SAMN05660880_01556 [Luteibacter sp. 22Crub2.1]
MNRFMDRLAELYAPLGKRGLLMDGQYRFTPDERSPATSPTPVGARPAREKPAAGRAGRDPAPVSGSIARKARSYSLRHPKGSFTA